MLGGLVGVCMHGGGDRWAALGGTMKGAEMGGGCLPGRRTRHLGQWA